MLSFRKKILVSNVCLFVLFISVLFPVVEKMVKNSAYNTLKRDAEGTAQIIEASPDINALSLLLKEPQFHFVCITLFDSVGNRILETHPTERYEIGPGFTQVYSNYYQQSLGFLEVPITIQGSQYTLRLGYPIQEVQEFIHSFQMGFILFSTLLLFLFGSVTQFILYRLTRPVQQIARSILKYSEGKEEFLRPIVLMQPDQGGEFDKIAFTLNSLSARIQKKIDLLTQQRKETEGILESLGEGVIAFSPQGKITFANEAACKMLGTNHDSIVHRSIMEIPSVYTDLLEKGQELLLQVTQTSEPIVETWTQKSVMRVYLDLIAAPLAHQNGAILVLQDKTSDYKVLEMGKDFIANASHELRTPITIIRGFAETLQDHPNLSKAMTKEIIDKIVRTCGRLEKLVKSLLTLSDSENISKTHFQTINLNDLVENCRSTVLAIHPDTKITVSSESSHAYLSADPDILEMAIANLLDNAVKYSSAPAEIQIQIEKQESQIRLSIKDSGIGIPEADVPHIFDRFYTVDKARSRKSGGAGLGLSIVKNIIEKHSGSIEVLSKMEQGTTFILSLPLSKIN